MPSRFHTALFALAFGGTLIVTAPATLLSPVVDSLTEGRIKLANCRGSVWRGGAMPLLRLSDGQTLALPAMSWQVGLSPVFSGAIKADVRWDERPEAETMQLSLRGKQLEIQNMRLPLPAQMIGELSPFLKPAQLGGLLDISSEKLSLSDRRIDGKATIHWKQAGSKLSSINPLGNYKIDVTSDAGNAAIVLSTTSGILHLEGRGGWSAGQEFQFRGKARAAEGPQETLAELLHHLGPIESPGVHSLSIGSP